MESSVGQSVETAHLSSLSFLSYSILLTSLRSFRVPLRNPILSSSPFISLIFPLFSSSFHLSSSSPLFLLFYPLPLPSSIPLFTSLLHSPLPLLYPAQNHCLIDTSIGLGCIGSRTPQTRGVLLPLPSERPSSHWWTCTTDQLPGRLLRLLPLGQTTRPELLLSFGKQQMRKLITMTKSTLPWPSADLRRHPPPFANTSPRRHRWIQSF